MGMSTMASYFTSFVHAVHCCRMGVLLLLCIVFLQVES